MQVAFGAAVVLLVLCGLAAYSTAVRLRTAQAWVSHTRDVQSALVRHQQRVHAGRAGAHPLCGHGNESFFQEYQAAAGEIPAKLQRIDGLTSDNSGQRDLGQRLAGITNRRLDLLNRPSS